MSGQTESSRDTINNAVTAAGAKYLGQILLGPNANTAMTALGQALLSDSQASEDDIATEIRKNSANLNLLIQTAEQQCLSRLAQTVPAWDPSTFFPAPADLTANEFDNTKDARERQIQLHDETNKWLAYGVSAGFFILIILIFWFRCSMWSDDTKDLLFTLLGVVATGWANIIGFYFGSSAGSQQKSQTLTAALGQATKNQQS